MSPDLWKPITSHRLLLFCLFLVPISRFQQCHRLLCERCHLCDLRLQGRDRLRRRIPRECRQLRLKRGIRARGLRLNLLFS